MPAEARIEVDVHFPAPRSGSINVHSDSEVERVQIEAMSYEVIEATRNYDEERVAAYVREQLVELEKRLGIKFSERSILVTLPTNRERIIEIDDIPSGNGK